jgi:hypothetical protein
MFGPQAVQLDDIRFPRAICRQLELKPHRGAARTICNRNTASTRIFPVAFG